MKDHRTVRLPLVLEPQPQGGYTVTSPSLRGLVTEGDTIEEALEHAKDAFHTVLEFYEDDHEPLPEELFVEESDAPITAEIMISIDVETLIPV